MQCFVKLGAKFGADGIADLMKERFIEGGGHADGLGKDRGDAGARHSVKSFVPPIVFRNAKARNGRSGVAKLRYFFFESHARNQVVDTLLDGKPGIEIRSVRRGLLRAARGRHGQADEEPREQEGTFSLQRVACGQFHVKHLAGESISKSPCVGTDAETLSEAIGSVLSTSTLPRRKALTWTVTAI